jgi:hypothetical protein
MDMSRDTAVSRLAVQRGGFDNHELPVRDVG